MVLYIGFQTGKANLKFAPNLTGRKAIFRENLKSFRREISNLVKNYLYTEAAEWGGVGCDVTITAGELGVEELQLDVFDDESG